MKPSMEFLQAHGLDPAQDKFNTAGAIKLLKRFGYDKETGKHIKPFEFSQLISYTDQVGYPKHKGSGVVIVHLSTAPSWRRHFQVSHSHPEGTFVKSPGFYRAFVSVRENAYEQIMAIIAPSGIWWTCDNDNMVGPGQEGWESFIEQLPKLAAKDEARRVGVVAYYRVCTNPDKCPMPINFQHDRGKSKNGLMFPGSIAVTENNFPILRDAIEACAQFEQYFADFEQHGGIGAKPKPKAAPAFRLSAK